MKKSTEQLQKIKELAISKRKEFLSVGECGSCEVDESIDTLTYKLDTIIAESMPRDAFQEIAQIVREHHEWHKEELEWSNEEIENSLVELSIEIDNI